jgi:Zn-dependent metalloprotease
MRNKISHFLILVLAVIVTLSSAPCIYGQQINNDLPNHPTKIVKKYHPENLQPISKLKNSLSNENAWVEQAINRSMAYLKVNELDKTQGLSDVNSKLALRSAELDNIGITHLRLEQINNNVPVFGGQLTTHVDNQGETTGLGRTFSEAELIETTPKLSEAEAIETAKSSLDYKGEFAKPPTASLVILPKWIVDQKSETKFAKLTYLVELLIEGDAKNTARHFYFVDAKNGNIVWHYDNMQSQYGPTVGTGYSLYSGTVSFNTYRPFTVYYLQDNYKCPGCLPYPGQNPSYTMDMRNQTNIGNGNFFVDADNFWGDGPSGNYIKVAVDAHFGMSKTWDYFYNVHGRYGIDGNGFQLIMRVHYDVNYTNAFWNGNSANFGDGDGFNATSLVSVDTVAHEITHGLTEKTAGLIYVNESGGINESFSDIFGTSVEFYTNINPDYLVGEDWFTPSVPGDALRYMDNPPADGVSIDNYSQYYPGIDVHYSSGIQNKAFYLLATSIAGRDVAEKIFYRALTVYLTPSATFHDVRIATLQATTDLYGTRSYQKQVSSAWNTVGVF